MAKVAPMLGFATPDDLYVSVANNKTSPRLVANKVRAALGEVTNSQAEAEKRALASLAAPSARMPRISRAATQASRGKASSTA